MKPTLLGVALLLGMLLLPPAPLVAAPQSPETQAALSVARERLEAEVAPRPPRPMLQHEGSLAMVLFEGAWRAYKRVLSPHTGATCAYAPSCSRFGLDAVTAYGPVKGVLLTLDRLQRDHPYAYRYHREDPETGRLSDPASDWCRAVGGPCP